MKIAAGVIADLRRTFRVATAGNAFADTFYQRLFEIDPTLEARFVHVDMRAQGAMIEQAVRLVLDHLDDLEAAQPIIESLGFRHRNYGVEPQHYQSAARAFIRTLEDLARDDLDTDAKGAWGDVLDRLTQVMIDGADRLFDSRRERVEGFSSLQMDESFIDPYVRKFLPAPIEQEGAMAALKIANLPRTIEIEFIGDKLVSAAPLQTLLDVSLENDIAHHYICGGAGRCSTCRVTIVEGLENCLPRNQIELQMAQMKGLPEELRLACQTRVSGPCGCGAWCTTRRMCSIRLISSANNQVEN